MTAPCAVAPTLLRTPSDPDEPFAYNIIESAPLPAEGLTKALRAAWSNKRLEDTWRHVSQTTQD